MAIFPSVNHCLKRFFSLFNVCSRKKYLITKFSSVQNVTNIKKHSSVTNYIMAQSRCSISGHTEQVQKQEESDEELDEDEIEEKLILNGKDDSDDENEKSTSTTETYRMTANNNKEVNKNNKGINTNYSDINNNNSSNCGTTNINIESGNSPIVIKKNKKFKYDSDVVILYNDICDLPESLLSPLPTEDEIRHVNSGGAEYDYGSYTCEDMSINSINKKGSYNGNGSSICRDNGRDDNESKSTKGVK